MGVPTVASMLTAFALIVSVTTADLEKALGLGRGSDAARARFHATYTVELNTGDQLATVEQIDVVSEFRRAVMLVEERATLGDRMFGRSQLETALRPFHNQVAIRSRLRLNPMNALPDVPDYELRVGPTDDRLLALGPTSRKPIYSQRAPDEGQALIGATLELAFDSGVVGQNAYPVSIVLDAKTIASTTIDFARLQ